MESILIYNEDIQRCRAGQIPFRMETLKMSSQLTLPLDSCICGKTDCAIPYGLCHCGCGQKTQIVTCTVEKLGRIKGSPAKYFGKHRIHLEKPLADRFWEKIDRNGLLLRDDLGRCWTWTASLDAHGYGQINGGKGDNGVIKFLKAHRVSWELNRGPIPEGLGVLHHCDNPPCCRPDHLFTGTNDENMKDAAAKARFPRGLDHHKGKFTEEQVREIRRLLTVGEMSQSEIGNKFGVSRSAILGIHRKDNYAYVEG